MLALGTKMNEHLKAALEGEDDLGVVIRSHIVVEQYINKRIESSMTDVDSYRSAKIDYHSKVKLAVGLGLNPRFERFLNCLGTLRNEFAHKLGRELQKEDSNNLYKSLNEEDKKVLQTGLKKTKNKLGNEVPLFEQCTPKDKYILCVITMCRALEYAFNELPNE